MEAPHVLVLAPLVVFALFFILIVLLRSFFVLSRSDQRRSRNQEFRSTLTTLSVESVVEMPGSTSNSTSYPQPNPPGYYSEVMTTETSAVYPVYVPPYAAPLMSLRDPRQFNGLPGLQAPPPYPPPPSYNQIHNFPELPTGSNTFIDTQSSRSSKKMDVTPVE
ncbi:unnamed protein product [Caenorhabditis auriculariae]|uniref:Uncharacterized protein n=1 Tax=Caenorhabditis auriculariae TaxID=2777116 RepID=A0A8S1HQL8_9PELO|nr:unnamed protein product [Caenorhabditis auriculariae]